MRTFLYHSAFSCAALALVCAAPGYAVGSQQSGHAAALPQGQSMVLDHVVAAINGSILLQSDVDEEMRFAVFQSPDDGGHTTPQAALQRLINRDLILQQINAGQGIPAPSAQQVQKQVSELRRQIPQCGPHHCETEAGWKAFLAAHGLTEAEFLEHWRQRMLILDFIQARFGAGIRISPEEIREYYDKNFVPQFAQRKMTPPALATVSSRIQEILLQQRVNAMLEDWLQSLRSEGSVSILDPAYGQVGTTGSGEDDDGPGGQP